MTTTKPIESNKVRFYSEKNCTGESIEYSCGNTIWFKPGDKWNDKFMSCMVGSKVYLEVWQDSDMKVNDKMKYLWMEPNTVNNDLSSILGISKIQIFNSNYQYVVDCRFDEKIGGTNKYELVFSPHSITPPIKLVPSKNYSQIPLPMQTPDTEIICVFTIIKKDELSKCDETVCKGNVYWKWTKSTGLIHCRKVEGFPSDNISIQQDDNTSFTFTMLKK